MKKIQPHLKDKRTRRHVVSVFLPSSVRIGLQDIATDDNTSTSAICAEIICGYFKLDSRTGRVLNETG